MAETTHPVDAAAARAARLAAIEARLNPPKEEEEVREPGSSESPAPPVSGNGSRDNGLGAKRSAREEAEKKRELARTLQRTIVRDSGYAQAAGCVETLLKIATNIITSDEEKYRRLKVDNATLRNKVYSCPGGREFVILMGFHSETHEHVQYFVMGETERHRAKLELAAEVLKEALPDLQARVTGTTTSKMSHKADEARRVALAKLQIEADRDAVKDRTERERLARLARAQVEAREAQMLAEAGNDEDVDEEDQEEIWGEGQKLGA